jgi:hypothetical protein
MFGKSLFVKEKNLFKTCRWAEPKSRIYLLGEQGGYLKWTEADHLRRATLAALRDDKAPPQGRDAGCNGMLPLNA